MRTYQKYLLPIAAFLTLCAIGFQFGKESTQWWWNDFPLIALGLILITFLLVSVWIRVEGKRVQARIEELQSKIDSRSDFKEKIKELTPRQREVLELILQGKSNKEILSELYIELSTLKTHINQIYKKLEVRSRREIRGFSEK